MAATVNISVMTDQNDHVTLPTNFWPQALTNDPAAMAALSNYLATYGGGSSTNSYTTIPGTNATATTNGLTITLSSELGRTEMTTAIQNSTNDLLTLANSLLNAASNVLRSAQINATNDLLKNNISYWGAVGDGVTDNSAAISNCVYYVSSIGGGIVTIPVGVFALSNTITISTNITIRGVASSAPKQALNTAGSILRGTSTNKSLLLITNADLVTIEDMTFQNTNTVTMTANLITESGYVDGDALNINRCNFYGGYTQLELNEVLYSHFTSCGFYNPRGMSVHLKNVVNADGGDNEWSGCTFSGQVAGTEAFQIDSSSGTRIENCKFLDYSYVIVLTPTGGNQSILLVHGCSIENFTTHGIYTAAGDSSTFNMVNVTGCEFMLGTGAQDAINLTGGIGNYGVLSGLTFSGTPDSSRYLVELNTMTGVQASTFGNVSGAPLIRATSGSGNTYNGAAL